MSNKINLPTAIKSFLIKQCKLSIFVLIILPFIIAVFNSYFFPKHFALLIKHIMNNDLQQITSVVYIVIIATLTSQVLRYLQNRVLYDFLTRLNHLIEKKSMEYLCSLPMELDVVVYGEKVNALSQQVVNFLQISFSLIYKSIVSIFITITVLLINNHFLIRIFAVFFVVFSFILYKSINDTIRKSEILEKQLVKNKLYVNDITRNFFFEKLFRLHQTTMKIFSKNLEKETQDMKNKYHSLTHGTLLCNGLVAITSCTIMFINATSDTNPTIKIMIFQVVNRFFMEMNDFTNMVIPLLNNFGAIREQYAYFKDPITSINHRQTVSLEAINKVEMKNVFYNYNNRRVVHDFSYTFNAPGIYFISGESGKGKSTIAQIISGIRKPASGEIIYNGDPAQSPVGKINYMTQSDGIYDRTVWENIFIEGEQNISDTVIRKLGMSDLLDREAGINGKNLSGGQVRRINLLRMLNSYKPGNLLIFDEPFIELDDELVDKIMEVILSHKNNIIIIIDHTNTLPKYTENYTKINI